MSYPIINSVGWKFRELFDSPASALANGAEIRGGSFDSGSYTGGGNDAGLQYSRPDFTSFAETGFSMGLRFTPQDDPADSVIKRMFSYYGFDGFSVQVALQKSTSRIWAQVQVQPGVSGYLVCSPASTPILWGEENYLFITYDGTTLSYYFNGVFQVSDNATGNFALTPDATPNILKIEDLSQAYSDPVQEFVAYDRALSEEEINDIIDEDTFQEVDESQFLISLPLRSNYNDGVNQVTRNIGSLGGTAAVEGAPEQLTPKGFVFDGTNYVSLGSSLSTASELTILVTHKLSEIDGASRYLWIQATSGGGIGIALRTLALTGEYQLVHNGGAALASTGIIASAGKRDVVTFTLDSSNNGQLTVNGQTTTVYSLTIPDRAGVGYLSRPTNGYKGDIYGAKAGELKATPTQIKWLHQKEMNLINQ